MPLTLYGEQSVAYPAIFGGVATPVTYYFGLQTATLWTASTVISSGAGNLFIIPTAFNTFTTSGTGTNRVFVASTTGTTGATEPAWSTVAAGGSIVDGTVVWQDVASTASPYWLSATPTFNEVSTTGTAYARAAYANSTSNFPAPSGSNPATGTNANAILFSTSTSAWGTIVAVTIHSASTGGSVIAFAYLSKYIAIASTGVTPSIPALTGLTLSLT